MNEYDSIGDLAHREDAIGHREPAESPDIELHNNPQHQNAPAVVGIFNMLGAVFRGDAV
jgi:hypothetical protein